ncbi:MFS general substrate transporter [Setomelanomma holmii]|uniref:MFS general substrate transporter n=1 Tax=Setomelanomma holmii TaxID=210430 RepID=A0A9P4GXL0_9PLEO|nr:MFS general substrate transporter [Setomelanomma holmii]
MAAEKVDSASSTEHVEAIKQVHTDGTVDMVDTHAIGGELADMPKGYFRSVNFIGTVIAVCTGSICAYLGWVLPANTLALINQDIGPSPNLGWVGTVWILGSAVGFLLVGRLSDIFGRKWMVIGTTVLSIVGNIVGATAHSIETLIAANACNGVAAAGQLSFGIVLGELVPNKQRGPIVTLVFMSSLPFAVFGPIIARKFIDSTAAGWRWSYYLGIIFGVITIALYQFLYHPPTYNQLHVNGKTKWQAFKELDFVGIFLFIAGCVLFLIGVSWGGQVYPWTSAHVLCTIIIGIFTLFAFGLYEQYLCHTIPLMPPRLFKDVGFVAIVVAACIGAMVYYSMTIVWPTLITTVYTPDVIAVGWQSSVVGGGVLLGQFVGGLALSYLPKVKWQCITLAVLATAFVGSLAALGPDTHTFVITMGVLGCFVIGWIDNITFPGVTLVIEPQDIGLATGVLGSIRALGGAVAQAIYVSILTNKSAQFIPSMVTPAATNAGLPASSLPALFQGLTLGNFTAVPGINTQIIAATGIARLQHMGKLDGVAHVEGAEKV